MKAPIALAGVLAVLSAAPASAATRTIRWNTKAITHIGSLRTTGGPTIARATQAFGRPSSTRLQQKVLCVVDWTKIGLRVHFVYLGLPAPGKTTCTPSVGLVQSVTIRGSSFRTERGLRIGDTTARLRSLYPGARFKQGSWWLASRPAVIGGAPGQLEPYVRANVTGGKVTRLLLFVGAAGD